MPKAYSDKERLDWLTKKEVSLYRAFNIYKEKWWLPIDEGKTYLTPRQAIDAAMRAEKKGGNRER